MLVWRRVIFPILMFIVLAAIAAALVKVAFFSTKETAAAVPQSTISDPVVAVEKGSVTSTLSLTGNIARDEDVKIRNAGGEGTITEVKVAAGATVAAGQVLFSAKQPDPEKYWDVVAPEAGTLTAFDLVKGQAITLGGEAATLTPNRFHVVATVQPAQLYRLVNAPAEATVTISGGPAPFTCTGVKVAVAQDGTASVQCAIPADQTVFAGLPVTVDIALGQADDALLVPVTAVKGGAGSGKVWVVADGVSEPEERDVKLGLSDGTNVAVTEGLAVGDSVRQFVPGTVAPVEENCYTDPSGAEYCDQGGSW